jgi:hypothetical protein
MSLRPQGARLNALIESFRGTPRLYCMHEGLLLPEDLVVLHEHNDHYSL